MNDKRIIAIVGATGAQGGGLARAILNDPNSQFAVRALTRKLDSEKAKELQSKGAELAQADLDDVESLKRAFSGAYAAFCVTNFWEHFSPEKELQQAKNMAQAAKEAGVQLVIWSTLEDTRKQVPLNDDRMPTLMGKYKVPHYDGKGEADKVFAESGVPTIYLLTSFYWDNLIYFGMGPKPGPDGVLQLTLPLGDAKLPGIAAEDIGKAAYGVLKEADKHVGKYVAIAGGHPTGQEMAEGLTRALGREVRYNAVAPEQYRAFGFPGAEDLGNMFQYKRDFNEEYTRTRDVDQSRRLNPELMSYDEWLSRYGNRIPVE